MRQALSRNALAATVVALVAVLALTGCAESPSQEPASSVTPTTAPPAVSAHPTHRHPASVAYIPPLDSTLLALPEANYDALIPGLLDAKPAINWPTPTQSFTLHAPLVAVYGADHQGPPIAVLKQTSFTGQPTVIIPVASSGVWTEIFMPSRSVEPSVDPTAPTQTMGWVRTETLVPAASLPQHIEIDVSAGTLKIVTTATGVVLRTFTVGTGRNGMDSPISETYIASRFNDQAQVGGRTINLTGAHSSLNHPYGPDQGLIALHWAALSTGLVSHGCVRLGTQGSAVVEQLPLGTPIRIIR